jgi:hypothetical protein
MANFLYNGIELPDINEVWTDKEAYPYAAIVPRTTSAGVIAYYSLYVASKPWYVWVDSGDLIRMSVSQACTGYSWDHVSSAWKVYNNGNEIGKDMAYQAPIWCSQDIFYGTFQGSIGDTLYLAASDPIPVGGTTPEYAIIPTADYKAACDAIRAKTGKTDLIKSGGLKLEVESIPSYITVATEEEATDTTAHPIVEGQVIVVTGA